MPTRRCELPHPATLALPDRRFGAFIFDCDGTLADSMPLHYRAWTRVIGEYGGQFREEQFYALGGKPTEAILALLRDEQSLVIEDISAAATRKEQYYLELIDEVKPIDAVVQIAREWHSVLPLAVASGGFRRYVERTLEVIGIRELFEVVVCAEDYARGKPHPDPFLTAALKVGVATSECLVFEDSELGIRAAEAAGMWWVFVPRGASN